MYERIKGAVGKRKEGRKKTENGDRPANYASASREARLR